LGAYKYDGENFPWVSKNFAYLICVAKEKFYCEQ